MLLWITTFPSHCFLNKIHLLQYKYFPLVQKEGQYNTLTLSSFPQIKEKRYTPTIMTILEIMVPIISISTPTIDIRCMIKKTSIPTSAMQHKITK